MERTWGLAGDNDIFGGIVLLISEAADARRCWKGVISLAVLLTRSTCEPQL